MVKCVLFFRELYCDFESFPQIVEETTKYYYEKVPQLWGTYGFKNANLDKNWFSNICIGIDKGIGLLMIENYKTGLIWNIVSKNKYIKKTLDLLDLNILK